MRHLTNRYKPKEDNWKRHVPGTVKMWGSNRRRIEEKHIRRIDFQLNHLKKDEEQQDKPSFLSTEERLTLALGTVQSRKGLVNQTVQKKV